MIEKSNKEIYSELIKIFIISLIKIDKEIDDYIITCNNTKNLLSIIAERKADTLPYSKIFQILELSNNECQEFVEDITNITNDISDIDTKVDKLLEKYII